MLRLATSALLILAGGQTALAGARSDGGGALALAALIGAHAPSLTAAEKKALAGLLEGRAKLAFPAGKTIRVAVDRLTCRASNVDIAAHTCDLAFGDKNVAVSGRPAHELFATLIENGVPLDGAAGSFRAAVLALECEIDPGEIAQKAGGGAQCDYQAPQ